MTFGLKVLGLKAAQAGFRRLQQGQERAAIGAANSAAFAARTGLIAEAARAFQAPTPYIAKGWAILKARNLSSQKNSRALVVPRDTPGANRKRRHQIFRDQIEGTAGRGLKSFEVLLANQGRQLPSGYVLVPTRALRLDRRGNVPRARLRKLIDGARDGSVWIGRLGNKGPLGVWEIVRRGGRGRPRPRLLMLARQRARYRPRFRLEAGLRAARIEYPRAVERLQQKEIARALRG